ncbi:MAG: hypothetical protein KatS3mg022_2413 [Armatimonadota bacterium]|nr:MAG: hypothetical protein KatS3mg022_2413 [Armatimonadota bacterium]
MSNRQQRLQKILAQAGYGSRRACEQLILQGRVRVNGQVVTQLGTQVDARTDIIEVDGKRVQLPEQHTYILLHKPAGVVTTRRDAHAVRTVMDLLQGVTAAVFPVGRLDADTTGALLLTDDGELAYRLTHPRYGVTKTYLVEVRGEVGEEALRCLREGGTAGRWHDRSGAGAEGAVYCPAQDHSPAPDHPRRAQATGQTDVSGNRASRRTPAPRAVRFPQPASFASWCMEASHRRRGCRPPSGCGVACLSLRLRRLVPRRFCVAFAM